MSGEDLTRDSMSSTLPTENCGYGSVDRHFEIEIDPGYAPGIIYNNVVGSAEDMWNTDKKIHNLK